MKHVSKGVALNPGNCVSVQQRIAFMRLAVHVSAKPEPWSQSRLAEAAGLSEETVNRVEAGRVRLTRPVRLSICRALTIPSWLLDCPMDKWLKVVGSLGLEAKLIVCGRKDLAKAARKKSQG